MSFQATVKGVTVTDEVLVTGTDAKIDRVFGELHLLNLNLQITHSLHPCVTAMSRWSF